MCRLSTRQSDAATLVGPGAGDGRTATASATRPTMEVDVKRDCAEVDWKAVSETLKRVGMAHHEPEAHRRAFEASHATVFVYRGGRLIGFGRAISDGVYQAAIYDCAVLPEFQGQGIGTTIVKDILARISHCNVILYASPGKERLN